MQNLSQIILGVVVVVLAVLVIKNWDRIQKFLSEVVVELAKVSWSTRQELLGATWIVIATTSILTLFVGFGDFALSKFLRLIIR